MANNIIRLYKSKNDFEKYWALELLSQASVRKELKDKDPEFLRPIFILKRKFLLGTLNKNSATDFSIFNLMKLGDIRSEYLWWILL